MKRSKLKRPHRDLIRFITEKEVLNAFGIDERHSKIFSSYLNEQVTMDELGERSNLTKERIRQIINECLMKTRLYLTKAPEDKKIHEKVKEQEAKIAILKDRLIFFRNFNGKFDILINELDIKVRTYNALMAAKFRRVGDLEGKTADEFLCLRNFGEKSLQDLNIALKDFGIKIKDLEFL